VFAKLLNVPTSKQPGKKLAVGRRPSVGGAPSHGTTGTIVNPALILRVARMSGEENETGGDERGC